MNLLIVTADLLRPSWGASARNYYLLKALAMPPRSTRKASVIIARWLGSNSVMFNCLIRYLRLGE